MPDIFDEMNMRQALDAHIPNGETLLAGIHAVSKETNVIGVFRKCIHMQDRHIPDASEADIQEVISDIFLADIGTCFLLADIQSCEIKKGWMGSVKCSITMKNESYFKLMFPKPGGLGGGKYDI